MSDWQVGDYALCIKKAIGRDNPTRVGGVYEVERVWAHPCDGDIALDFVGIFNGAPDWSHATFWGHSHERFTKLPKHEADAFDLSVIEQMTGAPVEVVG